MRGKLLIVFMFVLVGFSLVSAGSCNDNQVIMRLYASTNSHTSAWNQGVGTYQDKICYNDIFNTVYSGSNPHTCTGNNRVLSLYNNFNSHASSVHNTVYNYDVCYGDLVCNYDTSSGSSCTNNGRVVARMASKSNSHLSEASGNYPVKICCTSVFADTPYWADMNGKRITHTDFGDTVQMIAPLGIQGDFYIKDRRTILPDYDIREVSGNILDSKKVGIWTITSSDLSKVGNDDYTKFYFKIDSKKSKYLRIGRNGQDDPMNVTIKNPYCGEHFDVNSNVHIIIDAKDADDSIKGVVKINGVPQLNFTNGETTFDKVFNESGNFQISAESYNSRDKRSKAINNVMILGRTNGGRGKYIDGKYVAACIKEPKNFVSIPGSIVNFDASTTRGINIVNGVLHELIPGINKFSWYWIFYPQNIKRNVLNTTNKLAYKFTAEFPVAGDNSAALKVEV